MTRNAPQAVVLAAGLGTRMRPFTDRLPKPLLPVAGVTLIDRALDWLVAAGVREAVVNSYYLAELLEAHLTARTQPAITISREETLLETGGGLKKALPLLRPEPFVSVNSDVICLDGSQPALHRLLEAWDDREMDALLLLHPVDRAVGYDGKGDFFLDNGLLRRRRDEPSAPYVFTGVQLVHPRLFAGSPAGAFSMNVLYNRGMDADGRLHRIRALVHDGDWLHVGDPDGLRAAEAWFSKF